ncbi:hypothetical protein PPERSA_01669 [Pseudocohnilembus persalinus]|uniref:Membrane bound O-acyl transferase, MBOAT n=1 Tax=Pseudocohnilembus persalinus TaxID=266149 RepID=A0A0V0R0S7_PSEPJ|nr:hypothetical protein PPERSA_01669 [Pseudocohnilembus persalinus]|eukprot:KRX08124.1 hypothetical protein PPERSA_01669 [Pseudocohnilembus persalinus]
MVFSHIEESFMILSDSSGVAVDQLKFVIGLMSIIPLGFVFSFIKSAWLRHFYGIFFGLFLEYVVYGIGIISMLLQTVIVYLLAKYVKNCGKIIMIETMIFVSAHHIYRQIYDYGGWTLDVSTILMMAVCKFTSFGYCVEDGRKKQSELSQDQNLRKIERLPHFLEFFSYIHFFGSSICGPAFDFYDFRLFINRIGVMGKIPFIGLVKATTFDFVCGAFFMAGTVLVSNKFDLGYIATNEFGEQHSWFYKFFYYNLVVTLLRFKYYGGWYMATAGLTATGLTYNGQDEKTQSEKFDRIVQCHPLNVELTHEIKTKVANWNMSVQAWLQRYVYFRLYSPAQIKADKKKANTAQNFTLMVSAFWHGFYPGYYTSFFQWGMMLTMNKMFYKWGVNYPQFWKKIENAVTYPVYYVVRFVFLNGLFNFFGCGFVLLSLEANWTFYQNLNFIPNIIVFAITSYLLATNIGQKPPKNKEETKSDKKAQ